VPLVGALPDDLREGRGRWPRPFAWVLHQRAGAGHRSLSCNTRAVQCTQWASPRPGSLEWSALVSKTLKSRAVAFALAATLAGTAHAADVTGAGASFIYPAMTQWSADYGRATGNKVNYQSIGSGGGIAQIKAGTVDFGSSD